MFQQHKAHRGVHKREPGQALTSEAALEPTEDALAEAFGVAPARLEIDGHVNWYIDFQRVDLGKEGHITMLPRFPFGSGSDQTQGLHHLAHMSDTAVQIDCA